MLEQSKSPVLETMQVEVSASKEENNSTNSEPVSDSEDHGHTDDDEDDRNHKHRRRESRLQSVDNGGHEQSLNNHNRKRMRTFEKGKNSFGMEFSAKEFIPNARIRRSGVIPPVRANKPLLRTRINHSFCPSAASGRIRNTGNWTVHDALFNSLGRMDFVSHMASQGPPTHPGLFMANGLPNGGPVQTGSWGAYGFMSGMGNGLLDQMHPLGALPPAVTPLLDLGLPRQRCKDFEERGFCLMGDMCPMEHSVNRIVINDMQSLSQFNLPVSIPNPHKLGYQNEQLVEQSTVATPSPIVGHKPVCANEAKPGLANDVHRTSGFVYAATANDADVYDPDQPLWSNRQPESGSDLPLPGDTNEQAWNVESSVNAVENELSNQKCEDAPALQSSKPPFRGYIQSKEKFGTSRASSVNSFEMQKSESVGLPGAVCGELTAVKANILTSSGAQYAVRTHTGRKSQKASRTLYVNGISRELSRRDALLAHFQKFGEVIDIYIPANSGKAFVQFSTNEEAEAALKAPDAVMGNRFIKLWWANRDRIPDERESSVFMKPFKLQSLTEPATSPLSSVPNKAKVCVLPTSPKFTVTPSVEKSIPTGSSKALSMNGRKSTSLNNRKIESLKLLEELQKKQEALDQKREEFRRQLEKLAEQQLQAGFLKKTCNDIMAEMSNTISEADSAENVQANTYCEVEKKSDCTDTQPMPKVLSAIPEKFNFEASQASPFTASSHSRFKLDKRTTTIRILPPLPSEIAEVSVLKDHFSSYGEVVSVVLEDTDAENQDLNLKPSVCCSAYVTYATRQSAEKAFVNGTLCKGYSLKFMWLTDPPNSSGIDTHQPVLHPVKSGVAEVQCEQLVVQSPSSTVGEGICSSSTEEAVRIVQSLEYEEITNGSAVINSKDMKLSDSSHEECQPLCSASIVADKVDGELAR